MKIIIISKRVKEAGNSNPEIARTADWLRDCCEVGFIKAVRVNCPTTTEIGFECEVPNTWTPLIINEATSIDGWFFKVINNKLCKF